MPEISHQLTTPDLADEVASAPAPVTNDIVSSDISALTGSTIVTSDQSKLLQVICQTSHQLITPVLADDVASPPPWLQDRHNALQARGFEVDPRSKLLLLRSHSTVLAFANEWLFQPHCKLRLMFDLSLSLSLSLSL